MMPTFCDIAGISAPINIDGISFLPELLGKSQKEHEFMVWVYFTYNYNWKPGAVNPRNPLQSQAVRMGNWKAVREGINKNPDVEFELFDLSKDPCEQNNVAAQFPQIVQQIEKILEKEHVDSAYFKK